MRLICIEGLDGVGKETISKMIVNQLQCIEKENGETYTACRVTFPNYNKPIGNAISHILKGACGSAPKLDPELLSPLYTLDRIEYLRTNICQLMDYDFVIMDRSYFSNFIYQASKPSFSTVDCIRWCEKNYYWELENTGLVEACDSIDVVLLELSEEDRQKQMASRSVKDTNETDYNYLSHCRSFIQQDNLDYINKINLDVEVDKNILKYYTSSETINRYQIKRVNIDKYPLEDYITLAAFDIIDMIFGKYHISTNLITNYLKFPINKVTDYFEVAFPAIFPAKTARMIDNSTLPYDFEIKVTPDSSIENQACCELIIYCGPVPHDSIIVDERENSKYLLKCIYKLATMTYEIPEGCGFDNIIFMITFKNESSPNKRLNRTNIPEEFADERN